MNDFKKYHDLKQIGRGSHGRVFQAYDTENNIMVAIKEAIKREKDGRHEAMIMKGYGKSVYLPELYEYFVHEGTSFIVMEYIEGSPVGKGDFYREADRKEEKLSVRITISTLEALAAIHESGYIHDDIRPKNILIKDDDANTVKVIDFTLAKKINEKYTIHRDLQDAARLCLFLKNGFLPESPGDVQYSNKELRVLLLSVLENDYSFSSAKEFIAALNPFCLSSS